MKKVVSILLASLTAITIAQPLALNVAATGSDSVALPNSIELKSSETETLYIENGTLAEWTSDNTGIVEVYYEKGSDEEIQSAKDALIDAQNNLTKVANEKTVKAYIDGEWRMIADPSAVAAARREVDSAQLKLDSLTMSSSAIITGKSGGTATVTAKTKAGAELICTVTVTKKELVWWQWLIKIFLLGWIWYHP